MKKKSLLFSFALALITALTARGQTAIQAWAARYSNLVDSNDQASRAVTDNLGNVIVAGFSDDGVSGPGFLIIKYSNAGVALWTNRVAGPGSQGQSIAVDASGDVFALALSVGNAGIADLVTLKFSGAGVPLWTNRYNGLGNENAQAGGIALDGSGNVIVAGSTVGIGTSLDYSTIKYSSAGAPLWTNRYNGTGNGYDVVNGVAVDGSGNVFVTGASDSGTSLDFTTLGYSSAGAPLWVNRYHAAGDDDEAFAVAAAGGNVFVTGYTTGTNGYTDYLTIAYTSVGTALWTNRYDGPGHRSDQAAAIVATSTNVFVTGFSYGGISTFDDYATIAYSSAGTPLWTNRYNGPGNSDDRASAIALDASGTVFVTGYSYGSISGGDYATIAYSSAGMVLWLTRYTGAGNANDMAQALSVDTSGNVFVTGFTTTSASQDWATIKYSNLGVVEWTNTYNGVASSESSPQGVAVDRNGNVLVTGWSKGNTSGKDFATIKYSSAGVGLWTNRFNGPDNGDDYANAVAVDASGNVFVAGLTPGPGGAPDFLTIAYSSAGTPLWTNQYNGPGNYQDSVQAIAVDGSGNVIVTGTSTPFPIGQNFATIKFSNAGVPQWTNYYSGPSLYDFPTAIATDASGNVLVTGYSQAAGIGAGFDYATVKYSSAGTPLWTNRYDGPANGDDYANAIALDTAGNAIVTGASTGSGSGFDYTTIKYSTTGVPLWTNRYSGPGSASDNAYAVATDVSGNIFVTGDSLSASIYDYITIAYSSAGAVLWTNRYHGAGNDNEAQAIVVDATGRVIVTGYSSSGISEDFLTIAYSNGGTGLWTNRYNGPLNGDDLPLTPRSMALAGNGSVVVIGQSSGATGGGRNDYATVQYVMVPQLDIRRTATNTVAVSWPSPSAGFHLQQETNLLGTNWSLVATAPSDDGTNKTLVINPLPGSRFYRLVYP